MALVAGGAALAIAASGCVPTAAQGVMTGPAAPPEPQIHLDLTLATAISVGVVVFVTAFLLGLWCGWMWRRRHGRRH